MKTPTIRSQLRHEGGFTLIEMLIGMLLTVVIFMLALPVIDGAFRTEGRVEKAALSVGDARVFSERVGRDLRLTKKVDLAGPTSLTVDTYVRHTTCGATTLRAPDAGSIPCTVTYSCSGTTTLTCTRQEDPGPAVTLVTGLSPGNVFSYPCPPNPLDGVGNCPDTSKINYVGIRAVLPNQSDIGGDAITLQDGTALRNVQS